MRAAVQAYAAGHLTSTAEPASQAAGEVTSQPGPASQPASQAAAVIAITADGEPSPGAACATPGCWQLNTSRFGLRRVPLCPACRAALEGREYKKELPPAAAKVLRRGAA
jgi:hypothetical protein